MTTDVLESFAMDDRQRQFARHMRAEPTQAKRKLWQRLRHDVALSGSHFRRQAAIGPFIVDFVSRNAKLVIELDGGQHDWQQASDASRTNRIEAAGYRVLRFWNNDVLGNIDGVLDEIQRALTPTPATQVRLARLAQITMRNRGKPRLRGGGEKRQRRSRHPRNERH